jgi:RHS repeat-associated protein
LGKISYSIVVDLEAENMMNSKPRTTMPTATLLNCSPFGELPIDGTCLLKGSVYANGEAIAEIDQDGNIYELHNDHLGTPRYITAGNAQKDAARGQLAGQQAFGPYGEEMDGTYNGQKLPSGYRPITGYTGHLNEDLTGLIYMKGRYYSPLWHRFINSDQGVDPASINQYAYVGGSPFMATDPSGMAWEFCITYDSSSGGGLPPLTTDPKTREASAAVVIQNKSHTVCFPLPDFDSLGDNSGGGDDGNRKGQQAKEKPPCDPAITAGPRVSDAQKKLFTNAVNLLNSSPLTSHQRTVLGHLKGIQLLNTTGRPSANFRTSTFVVNVNEYRRQGTAWTASQIAHESYHIYSWNINSYIQTGMEEERSAVNFQIGVGRIIGLGQPYINHLNNYINNPNAVNKRIADPMAKCQ